MRHAGIFSCSPSNESYAPFGRREIADTHESPPLTIMDNTFLDNKWVSGILVPGGLLAWGISSLVAKEIVIPIQWHKDLPFYDHIPLHGWAAFFVAMGLISASVCLHFRCFWGEYPRLERLTSPVSTCSGWAAGLLFLTALIVWLIGVFAAFVGLFR